MRDFGDSGFYPDKPLVVNALTVSGTKRLNPAFVAKQLQRVLDRTQPVTYEGVIKSAHQGVETLKTVDGIYDVTVQFDHARDGYGPIDGAYRFSLFASYYSVSNFVC